MTDRHVRLEGGYYVRRPQAAPIHESRARLALSVIGWFAGTVLVVSAIYVVLIWWLLGGAA